MRKHMKKTVSLVSQTFRAATEKGNKKAAFAVACVSSGCKKAGPIPNQKGHNGI